MSRGFTTNVAWVVTKEGSPPVAFGTRRDALAYAAEDPWRAVWRCELNGGVADLVIVHAKVIEHV